MGPTASIAHTMLTSPAGESRLVAYLGTYALIHLLLGLLAVSLLLR
jgi:hypothetical protein